MFKMNKMKLGIEILYVQWRTDTITQLYYVAIILPIY